MLFDTHAHYDDKMFDEDRYDVVDMAHKSGVSYILNASSDLVSAAECIMLAQKFGFIYAAVGIHPNSVQGIDADTLAVIAGFAKDKKVVAIGETGLDYHYDNVPGEVQRRWFAEQINLAESLNLPIIVHDREAHGDVMDIIKKENAKTVGGVFHCYSGSVEMAAWLVMNNFYISVGGPVTFKNAGKVIDVIKSVPDDRLLIETDCPYLTPEPYRSKRNDSGYIRLIAEKIAEIKGATFEEIARATMENAKRLFKIE